MYVRKVIRNSFVQTKEKQFVFGMYSCKFEGFTHVNFYIKKIILKNEKGKKTC